MKKKKNILLIGDMPGWAFDNIMSFVYTHLKNDFEFYYDYTIYNPRNLENSTSDCPGLNENEFITKHYQQKYFIDKIPIIKSIAYRIRKDLNNKGILVRDAEGKKRRVRNDNSYDCVVYLDYYMSLDGNFDSIISNSIVRGIFTDRFPPKGYNLGSMTIQQFTSKYLDDSNLLLAGSDSIKAMYENHFKGKTFAANMAYDETIFRPCEISKIPQSNKGKLIVGWTGNPKRSFKGYYEIIQPVINELIGEGYKIELRSQFEGKLNSLATFWQEIDLAIIMSEADAGPSMFMEASLCGVPSISTFIGMPSEIIIDNKNGKFIERNNVQLKNEIIKIYNDREILNNWRKSIRKDYIYKLGVQAQIQNWKELLEMALK